MENQNHNDAYNTIYCEHCGTAMSPLADTCPKCGRPNTYKPRNVGQPSAEFQFYEQYGAVPKQPVADDKTVKGSNAAVLTAMLIGLLILIVLGVLVWIAWGWISSFFVGLWAKLQGMF